MLLIDEKMVDPLSRAMSVPEWDRKAGFRTLVSDTDRINRSLSASLVVETKVVDLNVVVVILLVWEE